MARGGAGGRARQDRETFELAALLGALAFGLSDTLLALNHFIWHDTLTMFSIQPVRAVYQHAGHYSVLAGAVGYRTGRRVGSERSRARRGDKITHD